MHQKLELLIVIYQIYASLSSCLPLRLPSRHFHRACFRLGAYQKVELLIVIYQLYVSLSRFTLQTFSSSMYQTRCAPGWPSGPCRAESRELILLAGEPRTAQPIAQPRSKINPLIFKFCFIGAKLACFHSSRGLQRASSDLF